jgi:hypothetical protein
MEKAKTRSNRLEAVRQNCTVDFENDDVRVLRIKYGPNDKYIEREHGDGVLIFLSDHHIRFTHPDGKIVESDTKVGDTLWASGTKYLPDNLSDDPLELMLVEFKPS